MDFGSGKAAAISQPQALSSYAEDCEERNAGMS